MCFKFSAYVQCCRLHQVADSRTNDSGKAHGPDKLNFEYAVDEASFRPAPASEVLPDPDETLTKMGKEVRTLLARHCHTGKMNVPPDKRVNPFICPKHISREFKLC